MKRKISKIGEELRLTDKAAQNLGGSNTMFCLLDTKSNYILFSSSNKLVFARERNEFKKSNEYNKEYWETVKTVVVHGNKVPAMELRYDIPAELFENAKPPIGFNVANDISKELRYTDSACSK